MGRYRGAGAGAGLQGPPCLDAADVRRGGRCHRPDREEREGVGRAQGRRSSRLFRHAASSIHVAPAKAGAQSALRASPILGPRLRGDDDGKFAMMDRVSRIPVRYAYCPAAPPVGGKASAVLVGAIVAGVLATRSWIGLVTTGLPTVAVCTGSGFGTLATTGSSVTRLPSRISARDNSCSCSQGGTLRASVSRSPVPPMSNVYFASRPTSRSTIIRSCAV